jgi:hypothetical protein
MAVTIPLVTEFQNRGIKAAEAAFVNFRKQVDQAEGTMGKFKAGSKAIFDGIKANAGTFATAAAGAFVTMAAQGVTAFQDLALSSDKFAASTGLAVEEASRLIEVTGDIGIEAASVETAIGKMNQNLGKSPDLFEELGVQVEYAKDGTVDANETFLNVIDRLNGIKDPAEKARVATQLLGKGWSDMSTLINMGADELRKSLGQVSGAKTISQDEVNKAKKFRDTMQKLGDAVSDLGLMLGQVLVPLLSKAAEILTSKGAQDFFAGVKSGWDTLVSPVTWTLDKTDALGKALHETGDMLWYSFFGDPRYKGPVVHVEAMKASREEARLMREEFKEFRKPEISEPFEELRVNAERLKNELQNVADKWDILTGKLDQRVALDNAEQQLTDLEEAAAKAFGAPTQENLATYNEKAAQFAGLLASIAGSMGDISSREIQLRFTTAGPAAALDLARWLAGGAEYRNLTASQAIGEAGLSFSIPGRAMGGTVSAGGTYLVGERGPELLTVGAGGGHVTPMGAGGGNTINITVTSADPNQVVAAIQQWTRNNGAIPLTTTTNIRR